MKQKWKWPRQNKRETDLENEIFWTDLNEKKIWNEWACNDEFVEKVLWQEQMGKEKRSEFVKSRKRDLFWEEKENEWFSETQKILFLRKNLDWLLPFPNGIKREISLINDVDPCSVELFVG